MHLKDHEEVDPEYCDLDLNENPLVQYALDCVEKIHSKNIEENYLH